MYFFLRPGCLLNESNGCIGAVVGEKVGNNLWQTRAGKKDADRRPVRTERFKRFLFGYGRCPSVASSENDRLRDFRLCQFSCENGRRRNKRRDAWNDFVFDSQPVEPPHLFGCRAVQRRVAGMKTRYIETLFLSVDIISLLLIQGKMRRIYNCSAGSAMNQHLFTYQGPGIENHRHAA